MSKLTDFEVIQKWLRSHPNESLDSSNYKKQFIQSVRENLALKSELERSRVVERD